MQDQIQLIRKNAAFAVEEFGALTDFEFGFDRRSVEWLEGFVERQRERGGDQYNMIGIIGSFLGEAIIAAAGGSWIAVNGTYALQFSNPGSEETCFPFAKVAKQFESGLADGESILVFYDFVVDTVAKGKLPSSQ